MNLINLGIIVTAALSIILVSIQERGGGAGGAFGGGDAGGFYQRRRGVEKFIFIFTIVCIAAFAGLSLLNLTQFGKSAPSVSVTPTTQTSSVTATPKVGDIKVETSNGAPVKVENVTNQGQPASTTVPAKNSADATKPTVK